MRKLLYMILISIFVILGKFNAYGAPPVTDVNIVPSQPPKAPTNITVSAVTDTTAQVSCLAVTSALQYTVYLNGIVYSGSDGPQASIVGLKPDTNYSVYVIANNTGGNSPNSSTVNFTTLSPIPIALSVPTFTRSYGIVNIFFNPLPDTFKVLSYKVYLDGIFNTTLVPKVGLQTLSLTNLTGNHVVTVSAVNNNCEGPQSEPLRFEVSANPTPADFHYYNKSANSIFTSWSPVPGAAKYLLDLDNGTTTFYTFSNYFIFDGLLPDTAYALSLASVFADGTLSAPTLISVQTDSSFNLTVDYLKNKIFSYVNDLKVYIQTLFSVVAALFISNTLRLVFRR